MSTAHEITYRINNHDLSNPIRHVKVQATPAEIRNLVEEGYLVRERLIQGDFLEELRSAVDELALEHGGEATQAKSSETARFGGLFIRNLMDRHPAFLKLLHYEPLVSVARAVLGPQVQIHGTVIRITYPGHPHQETQWHFHQRIVPDPLPPLFARSRVIDNLIYLDDIDEATGPLCVIPRSQLELHRELPANDYGDKPGQVALHVPAGTCVTADANLWHRAKPTLPAGRVRRLIIWGYSPVWMKQVDRPGGGLIDKVLETADPETLELLGRSGWY